MAKYDESSITILEGLEAVKKRPGMYIGSTDKKGMHHLAWEIIDNGIDEIINGFGNKIIVKINDDNSITISDNGRGVPTGLHISGKSTPEVIYTMLHAGGKFESEGYKIAGGLHGVGASVVNALSEFMEVIIYRDGLIHQIKFIDGGKVDIPLKKIGNTNKTGTTIRFLPNREVFKNINFSFTTLCERMQESAFLLNNLTAEVEDEADEKKFTYHYENGIISFVEYINEDKKVLNKVLQINGNKNNIDVDIALQYTDSYNENILSFVNNVKTIDGGTHEVGFKTAITKAFNDYAKDKGLLKGKNTSFEGSDAREGLTAVINIKIPENILQFEGQTKGKLGTPIARGTVENIVYDSLRYYLEENREISISLIEKMNKSKIARDAARKAREEVRNGKNKKGQSQLSGKLTPAQTKNAKINELFIVEGNSAGGTAKKSRDRKFQAILPLRGKILNTEKAKTTDIFKNEEINMMINCIGAGVGNEFDVKDINYDKVIIMTDADDDGAHIQCLLLTFFYRFMKPLIEDGHLYIAMPPLYKIDYGKNHVYCWTDDELKELIKNKNNYKIQRYKGLGEMNPGPLWETTMNPESRNLIKVSINDAALAEKRVSVLMGDIVEPRKEWINENVEFSLEDDYKIA
ncbi:MAG: DNA topoisomerase IV subunit B [Bacilli bacterium]|nr:DNA topoisomerase IV subunit B [Bacilli bacterium]MDD4407370.1 DNA topoisomerase IV subunit B [Bacilli bacterium]